MADDSAELELPRGVALAWGVAANPQRGPKREMSVELIVEAAVEIADGEGLGAVSMAAVAARLGYTPMSLYRYVSAKDDLVLLMQEEATGLPPEAQDQTADWRARLEQLYRAQVQSYLSHPWVLDVPISGSPVTPNGAAWMDAGLHALSGTPLTFDERLSVMLLVTGHARWAGTVFAGYARLARETGIDDAEIARREDALFRQLVTADAYPDLREAIESGVFLDEGDAFGFGLARSLDGVASYIAGAAEGRHDAERAWPGMEDADIVTDKRFRESQKAVRIAEKALRDARRMQRQVARETRERASRHPAG